MLRRIANFLSRNRQSLGVEQTASYRSQPRQSRLWHYENRPPFSVSMADAMIFDPTVTIGMALRDGVLFNSRFKVSGHPEIEDFVQEAIERIWRTSAPLIFKTKRYGYRGFEVIYRPAPVDSVFTGKLVVDRLKDFHARDTNPITLEGHVIGIAVRNVHGPVAHGRVELYAPKSLWLTFAPENSSLFGSPLLEAAYPPFHEKWRHGGAIKMRELRMMKDSWIGDVMRYPLKKYMTRTDGTEVSAKDLAREVAENRASGGVMGLPSDRDATGNYIYDYQPPTPVQGATEILNYINALDAEIFRGLEIPQEILNAAETGSGYSGRSIPLVSFFMILQKELDGYIDAIDRQIIRPLVAMNWSREHDYTLEAESLVDTATALLGDESSGGQAGGASSGNLAPAAGSGPSSPTFAAHAGNQPVQLSTAASLLKAFHTAERSNNTNGTVDRLGERVAPASGATIGGIRYAAGRIIPAAAMIRASDDEIRALANGNGKG